jgi:hypothetical protein
VSEFVAADVTHRPGPVESRTGGATPLFICGTARSGTTLLVALLDSHPALAVFPDETYWYRLLTDRPLSCIAWHVLEFCELHSLKAVFGRPPLTVLAFQGRRGLMRRLVAWSQTFPHCDAAAAEREVREVVDRNGGRHSYWQCFLDLYDRLAGESSGGKRYWVEKTPSNERFVPLMEDVFRATGRYLHILRDPRDVIASWVLRTKAEGTARARTLVHVCYSWSQSIHMSLVNLKLCAGRYHVLRYEDLVRDTAYAVEGIAQFLGIQRADLLRTPTKSGMAAPHNSSFSDVDPRPSGILRSQIGRHGDVLSLQEMELVESLLYRQMEACGYTPSTERAEPGASTVARIRGAGARDVPSLVKAKMIARWERRITVGPDIVPRPGTR